MNQILNDAVVPKLGEDFELDLVQIRDLSA